MTHVKKLELEKNPKNKAIIKALQQIKDPELMVDIWTLGLIYNIKKSEKKVTIDMTFTSPICPYGPQLVNEVKEGMKKIKLTAQIELVFDPVWEPSEEVKEILGIA